MNTFNKKEILKELTIGFIQSNSILKVVALFWSPRRQAAFAASYGSMRYLDDLVDDLKADHGGLVPEKFRETLQRKITTWLECLRVGRPYDEQQQELLTIMKEFKIPIWPWENLASAMIYDMDHNGFATLDDFFRYAEGAAVAPGAVAMHIGGLKYDQQKYVRPSYDIGDYARPLALFSYLVHIIRDFQKDQCQDLNYFSDDLMRTHGLDRVSMKVMAEKGEITPAFKNMISEYCLRADEYRLRSRTMLDQLTRSMELRYRLSLEVLFGLYCQVFERIRAHNGNFTTDELNPSPQEKLFLIENIVRPF